MRRYLPNGIALFLAATGAAVPASLMAEGGAKRPPYHSDPHALETAALAVTRAILRSDCATARKELDRMAELAPPLGPDRKPAYGSEIMTGDRSLQITLVNAREYASAENPAELFNEFVWVQRTCLHCHEKLAPRASTQPSGSEPPPPR